MDTLALWMNCLTSADGYAVIKGAPTTKQAEGVSPVELGKERGHNPHHATQSIPNYLCFLMARYKRSTVRSFGGDTSALPRFSVGSLVTSTVTDDIRHFIRRRRPSAL